MARVDERRAFVGPASYARKDIKRKKPDLKDGYCQS